MTKSEVSQMVQLLKKYKAEMEFSNNGPGGSCPALNLAIENIEEVIVGAECDLEEAS
jgi:hypothetical protein